MTRALKIIEICPVVEAKVQILKPVDVDDDLDKKFTEWQELKRQIEILNLVSDKISTRLGELEGDLKEVAKGAVAQSVIIDKAIINYRTRNNTSTRYAELYKKALEISNDDQKKVLEEYKKTVTSHSITDSLKITDPDLQIHLEMLKTMSTDQLVAQLDTIKKIPDVAPKAPTSEGKILDLISKWISTAKSQIKSLASKFNKSSSSANSLLKLSLQN
jgi:hypothetical protein